MLKITIVLGVLLSAGVASATNYDEYVNSRFGFSIVYRTSFFEDGKANEAQDHFEASGEDSTLEVVAYSDETKTSLVELAKQKVGVGATGDQKIFIEKTKNRFTVQTHSGAEVVNERTQIENGVVVTIVVKHPKFDQGYEEATREVFSSLRFDLSHKKLLPVPSHLD